MSEFVLYGLVAIGLVVLVLQFLLLQRAGRKDETVEPGFRTIEGGLERLERELRQELARVRQEAASAARGDREEQAQHDARPAMEDVQPPFGGAPWRAG